MRSPALFLLLTAVPLMAAPPVNDSFASRITLTGGTVNTTGTNLQATSEPGENIRSGLMGATVWWSWEAPSSGWVKIDTEGSNFDTVLQISTGAAVNAQTTVAFNDQGPGNDLLDTSAITFLATGGTVYNLAVGGYDLFGPDTGSIMLQIITGAAAIPPWYPSTLTFSPASADVTSAAVPVTASFTVFTVSGNGAGEAGVGFGWEESNGDGSYIAPPKNWLGSEPGLVLRQSFNAPRYLAPGPKGVWFKIVPAGTGSPLIFSGPEGGSGYALPPAPAVAQSFTVTNTGPVDEEPPVLTAFSITPNSLTVTTAPAALQIAATLTDAPAGVATVHVELRSTNGVRNLVAQLSRVSGTAQSGVWNGSLAVPKLYPSDNYEVLVTAVDEAQNDNSWGTQGYTEIPGGDFSVPVTGGSAYERWAYTEWFDPGDPNASLEDDADGDGKANLLSYAFGLNPRNMKQGTGFLPVVELIGTGAARRLRISYIRRIASTNSGLSYAPQFSSRTNGIWETVTGGTANTIAGTPFEIVVVEDTATISTERQRNARVKVEYAAP